jgi:ParB/RepB/Spo0J family partition protein
MIRASKQRAPAPSLPPPLEARGAAAEAGTSTVVPIDLIDANSWNPRSFPKRPDSDDRELTASIARHGVLENLLVRPTAEGRYELIFGERRLRSAEAAGLTEVPTIIRAMDDHEARVLTVTENMQRKQLHFLQEADGVAALFEEHWTIDMVAAELGKPLSWVARRRRLLNLTKAWRQLAEGQEPSFAGWSAAHFEQIALLEAAAQDDLLEQESHKLARCATARELARLIGSMTRAVTAFPWKLGDADLDPVAGPCSSCPHRSSQHPGLFDDQPQDGEPTGGKGSRKKKGSPGSPADRCLSPLCAANKTRLFLDRKRADLAAKHSQVVLIQDGYLPERIPASVFDHQVTPAKKGTPGAVPALVANGPHLGQVRWVKLRQDLRPLPTPRAAEGPQRRSLAERQEQKWRQRKVHAIGLLKTALVEQPPPALMVSVRLAITFGTTQTHSSSSHGYDSALPQLGPGIDPAAERRRMLGGIPESASFLPDRADEEGWAPAPGLESEVGPGSEVEWSEPEPDLAPPVDVPLSDAGVRIVRGEDRENEIWRAFDALEGQDDACGEYLWARTLRVMLDRMTPNGDPRHVAAAWGEARRIASLVGLDAEDFLHRATVALPDPKSWAKELAQAEPTSLSDRPEHGEAPEEPPSDDASFPRALPKSRLSLTPRPLRASRLPR